MIKRTLDFVIAVILAVLLAPVFLAIALAIRLGSQGPAIFKQERSAR
jgi:lipopolysaccharide/colanic/teichoic acid biosynthesis glycosyltransferase